MSTLEMEDTLRPKLKESGEVAAVTNTGLQSPQISEKVINSTPLSPESTKDRGHDVGSPIEEDVPPDDSEAL